MAKKLTEIKKHLELHIGQKILLQANGGRKKMIEHSGILAETYPSIFIVRLNGDGGSVERVSYSYADVLTETVKLSFINDSTEKMA